jgi:hypothetical protein
MGWVEMTPVRQNKKAVARYAHCFSIALFPIQTSTGQQSDRASRVPLVKCSILYFQKGKSQEYFFIRDG